jgi:pentapeptide repeat protein
VEDFIGDKFRIMSSVMPVALFEGRYRNYKECLEAAVEAGADLSHALFYNSGSPLHLGGAQLAGAKLSHAQFSNATLGGANLRGADLSGANVASTNASGVNLSEANISGANFSNSNLAGADLHGTDLSNVNITRADLSGIDFRGVNLGDTDLSKANWSVTCDDLFSLLAAAKDAAPGLLEAVRKGQIDGSREDGGVIETLMAVRKHRFGLTPNRNRPIERLCLAIKRKDTPATNPFSKLLETWIEEWLPSPAAAAVIHEDLCPACGQLKPRKAAA